MIYTVIVQCKFCRAWSTLSSSPFSCARYNVLYIWRYLCLQFLWTTLFSLSNLTNYLPNLLRVAAEKFFFSAPPPPLHEFSGHRNIFFTLIFSLKIAEKGFDKKISPKHFLAKYCQILHETFANNQHNLIGS